MKHRYLTILSAFGMLILILDSQNAFEATYQGVQLCIQTIIPALFPFFILSTLVTSSLSGRNSRSISPLERLLGIPEGSGSIFLAGILGGYPVGARCIREAYDRMQLSDRDACRMLSFCSNAGPSFLFGMIAPFFPDRRYGWILWIIHILSAVITALLIPGKSNTPMVQQENTVITLSRALEKAIHTTAMVCGWVVLFRLILSLPGKWFFWMLPTQMRILLTGMTELSNGCLLLGQIDSISERFLIASVMLGFGGLCVTMQTKSIWGELPFRAYLVGKLLQTGISLLLAMDYLCISKSSAFLIPVPVLILLHLLILFGFLIFSVYNKKFVAIPA